MFTSSSLDPIPPPPPFSPTESRRLLFFNLLPLLCGNKALFSLLFPISRRRRRQLTLALQPREQVAREKEREREREKGAFSPSCLFWESRHRRWTKGDHNEGGGRGDRADVVALSPGFSHDTGRKETGWMREGLSIGRGFAIYTKGFFELCSLEYCTIRKEYAIYFDSINTIFATIEEGSFKSFPPRLIGPGLLDNRTLMTTMTEREKTQHDHPKRK